MAGIGWQQFQLAATDGLDAAGRVDLIDGELRAVQLILTAGGGTFAVTRMVETEGVYLGENGLSVEEVRDNWAKITDESRQSAYFAGGEQSQKVVRQIAGG